MLKKLPIYEPKIEDVAELFPHLRPEEIQKFIIPREDGRGKYIALPSLRVNGAFQIVSLDPEYKRDDNGKVIPVRINWSYAGRTRESYSDGRSHGDTFTPYEHMDRAIQFSWKYWGSDLVLDDWVDFVQIYVQDPTDLHQTGFSKGSPKTKAVLSFTTNRPWGEIINDHSNPESQVINNAIVEITTNGFVSHELKGGRGGYKEFNCANDGAGLGLSGCGECGNTFRDDQVRCGWNTPLPPKLTDYLISQGFGFKQDPAIAREKEAMRYQARIRKQ